MPGAPGRWISSLIESRRVGHRDAGAQRGAVAGLDPLDGRQFGLQRRRCPPARRARRRSVTRRAHRATASAAAGTARRAARPRRTARSSPVSADAHAAIAATGAMTANASRTAVTTRTQPVLDPRSATANVASRSPGNRSPGTFATSRPRGAPNPRLELLPTSLFPTIGESTSNGAGTVNTGTHTSADQPRCRRPNIASRRSMVTGRRRPQDPSTDRTRTGRKSSRREGDAPIAHGARRPYSC